MNEMKSMEINYIHSYEEFELLSNKYNINICEILQIDLNRCGVYLEKNEVKEGFRVRFKMKIMDDFETWGALPVRAKKDSPYKISENKIYFKDKIIGTANDLVLDTCDTSYQRGPYLLNLNSRSRSNCGGCKACIHNYHDLYDATVIKDRMSLDTKNDIENYFDKMNFDISKFHQIAIVTGLFRDEEHAVSHIKLVHEVAESRGFSGELMYFGCQVNSKKALEELSKLGKFYLIYAVDNFSKRDILLSKLKSKITLEYAKNTLAIAKKLGIKTSIAYIAGIDSLDDAINGFNDFNEALSSFPIINVYQIQTAEQYLVLHSDARSIEYYIKLRIELEKVFINTTLRPKRWENYRPLWYRYFYNEEFLNNSYGQLEEKEGN